MFKKILKLEDYSPKTEIEKTAIDLLNILKNYSECYFVGGYPRDLLIYKFLNKKNTIKDIDIAIKLNKKNNFKEFLESNNIDFKILNENFGVYLIKINNFEFQVATFRKDGKTSNGRKPTYVKFTDSMKVDSKRRDFTVNSMYLDPFKKVIFDFNGGIKDVKKQRIRFIGKAEKRVKEDYLRILRYFRFKNKYSFNPKEKDLQIIKSNSSNLDNISKERVKIELDECLSINNINTLFYEFDKYKILDILFPELKKIQGVVYKINDNYNSDVYTYSINCLKAFSSNKIMFNLLKKYFEKDFEELQNQKDLKDFIISKNGLNAIWASIFHEIGKLSPEQIDLDDGSKKIVFKDHEQISLSLSMDIMRRFGFTKEEKEGISWIINNHGEKILEIKNLNLLDAKKFVSNKDFMNLVYLYLSMLISDYDDESIVEKEFVNTFGDLINEYNQVSKDKKRLDDILDIYLFKEFDIFDKNIINQLTEEIKESLIEGKIRTRSGVIKYLENKTGKVYLKNK